MGIKQFLVGLAVLVLSVGIADVAKAVQGPYFARYGCGPWAYLPTPVYTPERVPYYALYPPVYYSYPIAEPYGRNPYVPAASSPAPVAVYPTSTPEAAPARPPLRITNPYVSSEAM
mgnify:CR=1 FL=1